MKRFMRIALLTALIAVFLLLIIKALNNEKQGEISLYTANPRSETTAQHEDIGGKIDINSASFEELVKLPNIGEKKARLIIEAREKAEFSFIEDLMHIEGIGKATIEKLRPLIYVNKK